MKIFRTTTGAIVEHKGLTFVIPDADWDTLVNRRGLRQVASGTLHAVKLPVLWVRVHTLSRRPVPEAMPALLPVLTRGAAAIPAAEGHSAPLSVFVSSKAGRSH